MDKVLQAVHSIREADLKTHDELNGIGSDVCYEEYLICKMRESQMLNIKAKYQEIEEKKKRKKFTISFQSIEAFIIAICTVQLIAFLMLTQKGKVIQSNIQNTAADAVYSSVTQEVSLEQDDSTSVLDSLLKEGLKSE